MEDHAWVCCLVDLYSIDTCQINTRLAAPSVTKLRMRTISFSLVQRSSKSSDTSSHWRQEATLTVDELASAVLDRRSNLTSQLRLPTATVIGVILRVIWAKHWAWIFDEQPLKANVCIDRIVKRERRDSCNLNSIQKKKRLDSHLKLRVRPQRCPSY